MKTILVIEDEKDLAELLTFNLEKEGYKTLLALDGISGLETAIQGSPDLILLDLMLPGIMGTEVCKLLKSNRKTALIPVIMLTARSEEIDKVVGFELGAEDYVVKPFSTRELLLRIKAVLRRVETENIPNPLLTIGQLSIDTERHLVLAAGQEIPLTSIEFKLLLKLAERRGRLQSRDQLLQAVWGYNYAGDTRTVDTHITRLRTKLGTAGDIIKTVRGFGYKLEES